jgi:hypothetical protein
MVVMLEVMSFEWPGEQSPKQWKQAELPKPHTKSSICGQILSTLQPVYHNILKIFHLLHLLQEEDFLSLCKSGS